MAERLGKPFFPDEVGASVKLAICVPARDQVATGFALDLALATAHSTHHIEQVALFHCAGTLIADQRAKLVKQAAEAEATHILWLDADMRFPADVATRLLAHDKPIVAANYATRALPIQPVAFAADGSRVSSNGASGLQEVAAVGMGCMLTAIDVFKALERPYFAIGYSRAAHGYEGEDIYFCRAARKAGFSVLIDHDLSREVRHVGTLEFAHEHYGD